MLSSLLGFPLRLMRVIIFIYLLISLLLLSRSSLSWEACPKTSTVYKSGTKRPLEDCSSHLARMHSHEKLIDQVHFRSQAPTTGSAKEHSEDVIRVEIFSKKVLLREMLSVLVFTSILVVIPSFVSIT